MSWLLSIPLGIILARRSPKEAGALLEHMDPGGPAPTDRTGW
jgi:hypothetical protein